MSDAQDYETSRSTPPGPYPPVVPDSVGGELRAAREARSLSVEDVSSALKIRDNHIEAIETGRFGDLPGQTYAIGFVRTYADYLGLDADNIVRRFKAEVVGIDDQTELVFRAPERDGRFPLGAILIASVVLAALIYGVWYYLVREPEPMAGGDASSSAMVAEEEQAGATGDAASDGDAPSGADAPPPEPEAAAPEPAAPEAAEAAAPPAGEASSDADAPEPTPEPTPEPSAAEPEPVPDTDAAPETAEGPGEADAPDTAAPPQEATAGSGIILQALDDSWVRIENGRGDIIFSRVLNSGETYTVPREPGLTMVTGNAGAIRVLVDGRIAPPLGPVGEVQRDIALTPEALLAGPSE